MCTTTPQSVSCYARFLHLSTNNRQPHQNKLRRLLTEEAVAFRELDVFVRLGVTSARLSEVWWYRLLLLFRDVPHVAPPLMCILLVQPAACRKLSKMRFIWSNGEDICNAPLISGGELPQCFLEFRVFALQLRLQALVVCSQRFSVACLRLAFRGDRLVPNSKTRDVNCRRSAADGCYSARACL
jgi:hypothetical protein